MCVIFTKLCLHETSLSVVPCNSLYTIVYVALKGYVHVHACT